MDLSFENYTDILNKNNLYVKMGKVKKVIGLIIHAAGLKVFIGEVCNIIISDNKDVPAEVVGFHDESVLLMPLGDIQGIGPGCLVKPTGKSLEIKVGEELLGTTLDGLGKPMDGIERDLKERTDIYRMPPNPFERKKIEKVMSTGIKAIDGILTCGEGQRIGIFAGSGVGKSTLMGMVSRYSEADVNVIGLIGERGREVLEFIQRDLGEEGYKKSVVVCATSDQPPLVRLKGAYVATAIAEYFRDQGKRVMFMMDSVTRFAMAQREIGLAIGEPPTTRGYTPSVFAVLPKLLERSGMSSQGSITAFYTVLVEGDDMNEPIADAVRGILDGHIVLSRKLAGKNHFPAIDVQQSVSRLMREIVGKDHYDYAGKLKENIGRYQDSEDLINVGAYAKGANPEIDRAVELKGGIDSFLKQEFDEPWEYDETIQKLASVFK
ncbi:flagellar protein export ATPase FliI [Alkalibacter mobilis]|uniref:flagellar protein export ATPase FliI n=1 Tax=Alkalibacter mobilis TaxID=2787712 RepID=UPI00189FAA3E|nr:flagellar protein export ATPase FliI [Alkalibacter mobilis]MBF7096321.1 flagellar protein export ATPase FliI [Alkalibacter mobilis]